MAGLTQALLGLGQTEKPLLAGPGRLSRARQVRCIASLMAELWMVDVHARRMGSAAKKWFASCENPVLSESCGVLCGAARGSGKSQKLSGFRRAFSPVLDWTDQSVFIGLHRRPDILVNLPSGQMRRVFCTDRDNTAGRAFDREPVVLLKA